MVELGTFTGATFDSREVRPGMLFVALKGEKADGHDFIDAALKAGAAGIVDGYDELNELARAYRRTLRAKVLGVTGSAGKTTTKELLKAFLARRGRTYATQGNFNNHIGLPLTILNCPPDADFLVLEMGTNHPGEIDALCAVAEPDAGLITNIGTAHLEFFKTQDGIADEKGSLFRALAQRGAGPAVAGDNNVRLERLRAMTTCEFVVAETSAPWMAAALEGVMPGAHNVSNACIAFALAERFGVTRADAVAALKDFALPGARWRKVEKDGVIYIDDTYNANPDAMIAALDAFARLPCDGKHVAVLGDMFELGEQSDELHRKVFDHAMALGIPLVIGVGEASSKCLCHLAYKTLAPLKKKFRLDVSSGDLVLLKASHAMCLGDLLD